MFSLSKFLIVLYLLATSIYPLKYSKIKSQEKIFADNLISSGENVLDNNLNSEDYIIGPGDSFELKFIKNEELLTKFRIIKDGNAYQDSI